MIKTCVIQIKDEVNCKLVGLDISIRKKLVGKFKFEIPGARYTPAVRLGRWDGKVAFFQLGGSTFINLLPEILPILEDDGYQIELEDLRTYNTQFQFDEFQEDTFSSTMWPAGHPQAGKPIVFRDYQVTIINEFLRNPQSIQEIATGAGKCQPLTSKVLTTKGWQLMKDIEPGSTVIAPSGKSVKVLDTFNPGVKDVYEILFSDGRTARCCADHIWRVYNIGWGKSKTGPWRNISTEEIIDLKSKTSRSIGIPLVTMEHDESDIQLPMDPWLMGFLLGDGSFRNNHLGFSTADDELVQKVKSKLDSDYTVTHSNNYDYAIRFATDEIKRKAHGENIRNKTRNRLGHIVPNQKTSANRYIQYLIDSGLMETYSHTKFIPEIYFSSSKAQRLELIRGLVDSDGTIDKGSVYFTSTSQQLAKDFQRLIHSVGGIAKLKKSSNRTYRYRGVCKPCKDSYTVSTKYPTPWDLVSLKRKKDKTGYKYQYGNTLKLNIISINKVSSEEVKCILIDDTDNLYITDDYIVTHNTIITAALSKTVEPYGRSLVIVPNKDLVKQTEADYRNLGLDVGVYYGDRKEVGHIHTICTWQSLNILMKNSEGRNHENSPLKIRLNKDPTDFIIDDIVSGLACVIVDEVHMAKADVLKTILTGIMAHVPLRWGLTGTVPKEDHARVSITCSIGNVVGKLAAKELQDAGHLAKCHVNIRQLMDHNEYKDYASELKFLVTNPERLAHIARMIDEIKNSGNTLVLVDRIETGKILQAELSTLFSLLGDKPDVPFISGVTKSNDRKDEYDGIATANNKVIIATYGVAAVGINIPRIFNLVLIEAGKSFVRVIQSIGRGIRKAEDKDYVAIYDITSNCKFAKRHLSKRKVFYSDASYPHTTEKVIWR